MPIFRRAIPLAFSAGALGGIVLKNKSSIADHDHNDDGGAEGNDDKTVSSFNSFKHGLFFFSASSMTARRGRNVAHAATSSPPQSEAKEDSSAQVIAGHRREDLPDFDLETIAQHCGKKAKAAGTSGKKSGDDVNSSSQDRIYVTYKAGVYDITDFIEQHPGGKKRIMLAAGSSIEKYWQQITLHDDDAVRTILESMRIGNIKGYDPTKRNNSSTTGRADNDDDDESARLWGSEPRRAAALQVVAARPFNAQTPDEGFETFLTNNDVFFVRNHMPVPLIDEASVELGNNDNDHHHVNNDGGDEDKKKQDAPAQPTPSSSSSAALPPLDNTTAGSADDNALLPSDSTPTTTAKSPPFCLQVEGIGIVNPRCFTVPELRRLFKEHTVATTIECGGNRRSEMAPIAAAENRASVKGLSWKNGAISTAEWSGFLLSDIIAYCSRGSSTVDDESSDSTNNSDNAPAAMAGHYVATVDAESAGSADNEDNSDKENLSHPHHAPTPTHIQFQGADSDMAGNFAVSVPYGLALSPDREAIIATKMNGEPIPRDHGYPLRAIVPGTVGVRNCKWLTKITVTDAEAQTVWQQNDYKHFPAYATKPDPSLPSVYAMPITSAITEASLETGERRETVVVAPRQQQQQQQQVQQSPPAKEGGGVAAPSGEPSSPSATTTTNAKAVAVEDVLIPTTAVVVKGYAYTGSGAGIQRVELSVDGGKTFVQGAHLYKGDHYANARHLAEAMEAVNSSGSSTNVDDDKNANKKKSTTTEKKAAPPPPAGPTNISADNQYNAGPLVIAAAARGAGAADSGASSPSSSSLSFPTPLPKKDWTWTLFSTVVDVTNVPPTDEKEVAKSNNTSVGGDGGDYEGSTMTTKVPCWKVCSRAVANDNAAQPPLGTYNFRGLLYNGYSCVEVCREVEEA